MNWCSRDHTHPQREQLFTIRLMGSGLGAEIGLAHSLRKQLLMRLDTPPVHSKPTEFSCRLHFSLCLSILVIGCGASPAVQTTSPASSEPTSDTSSLATPEAGAEAKPEEEVAPAAPLRPWRQRYAGASGCSVVRPASLTSSQREALRALMRQQFGSGINEGVDVAYELWQDNWGGDGRVAILEGDLAGRSANEVLEQVGTPRPCDTCLGWRELSSSSDRHELENGQWHEGHPAGVEARCDALAQAEPNAVLVSSQLSMGLPLEVIIRVSQGSIEMDVKGDPTPNTAGWRTIQHVIELQTPTQLGPDHRRFNFSFSELAPATAEERTRRRSLGRDRPEDGATADITREFNRLMGDRARWIIWGEKAGRMEFAYRQAETLMNRALAAGMPAYRELIYLWTRMGEFERMDRAVRSWEADQQVVQEIADERSGGRIHAARSRLRSARLHAAAALGPEHLAPLLVEAGMAAPERSQQIAAQISGPIQLDPRVELDFGFENVRRLDTPQRFEAEATVSGITMDVNLAQLAMEQLFRAHGMSRWSQFAQCDTMHPRYLYNESIDGRFTSHRFFFAEGQCRIRRTYDTGGGVATIELRGTGVDGDLQITSVAVANFPMSSQEVADVLPRAASIFLRLRGRDLDGTITTRDSAASDLLESQGCTIRRRRIQCQRLQSSPANLRALFALGVDPRGEDPHFGPRFLSPEQREANRLRFEAQQRAMWEQAERR